MTDTTDIAALREKFESVFDGNKERNKYHPDFYDAYPTRAAWKYYQMGNELHLSQLEAERQRADAAHKYGSERDAENESLMLTVGRLRAELVVLKSKLANPVVLPAGYSTRAGHPFHEGERNVMIPNKRGDWLSRFEVEHAIHVAGFPFTVEGE